MGEQFQFKVPLSNDNTLAVNAFGGKKVPIPVGRGFISSIEVVDNGNNALLTISVQHNCRRCRNAESPTWWKCCTEHLTISGPDVLCESCTRLLHPEEFS